MSAFRKVVLPVLVPRHQQRAVRAHGVAEEQRVGRGEVAGLDVLVERERVGVVPADRDVRAVDRDWRQLGLDAVAGQPRGDDGELAAVVQVDLAARDVREVDDHSGELDGFEPETGEFGGTAQAFDPHLAGVDGDLDDVGVLHQRTQGFDGHQREGQARVFHAKNSWAGPRGDSLHTEPLSPPVGGGRMRERRGFSA